MQPDLQHGVKPISAAASSLAALIRQAKRTHNPIIITQKGYPSGVLVDVETWQALCAELVVLRERVAEGARPETLEAALVRLASISERAADAMRALGIDPAALPALPEMKTEIEL